MLYSPFLFLVLSSDIDFVIRIDFTDFTIGQHCKREKILWRIARIQSIVFDLASNWHTHTHTYVYRCKSAYMISHTHTQPHAVQIRIRYVRACECDAIGMRLRRTANELIYISHVYNISKHRTKNVDAILIFYFHLSLFARVSVWCAYSVRCASHSHNITFHHITSHHLYIFLVGKSTQANGASACACV